MYNSAIKILNLLNENGYESYIIGGYVRDKLLNIESDDIDIITNAKPSELSDIFNIEIVDNYGSCKLKYNNYIYDITTFRKEFDYIDNRRPSNIEYVNTLKEDLNRRDFTINTICIDANENYIDLLGGIEDLKNKLIRCVGDADKKIKEDSLRILRAIRFSCLYDLSIDGELAQAIYNNKSLINNLSFDRIKRELNIIFMSGNLGKFTDVMNEYDLYETLKIKPVNGLKKANNYLSIWGQLEYCDNYNFSNEEKKYINDFKDIIKLGIDNYTIYKYDREILEEAKIILDINVDIEKIYNNLPIKSRKDIDIEYEDLCKLFNDKSNINKIYMELEKEILYNRLNNTKANIILYLKGDNNE